MNKSMRFLAAILGILLPALMHAAKTETLNIATQLVPGVMNVTVITPDGYAADTRFPTVYLLNGYSGDNTDWTQKIQPRLGELADLYGMVMVMPDGRDSWYWDSPVRGDMKMESFITKELVPYIDSHYPTDPQASKRAITGLSMGGHGALWLAMRHSDIFGNAGSMSGGVDIRPFKGKWKTSELLGDPAANASRYEQYTVMALVPALRPDQLNIIFDCGSDDFFAEVNDKLHKELLARKIPHDYTSRPGGHSRPYWANSILYHLLFFNEHFNKE